MAIRLSDLCRKATDEEKPNEAEEQHRLRAIGNGIHPDTGYPLRLADRHTLRGLTEHMRFETWWVSKRANALYSSLDVAVIGSRQDTLTGLPDRAAHHINSPTHSMLKQTGADPITTASILSRATLPNSAGRIAVSSYSGLDSLPLSAAEKARADLRGPETTFVRSTVTDLTPISAELRIAKTRIIETSSRYTRLDWNLPIGAGSTVANLVHDESLMASDASRVVGIYGLGIAAQTSFLPQQEMNLSRFRSTAALTPSAFERADLLARTALWGTAGWDNGVYQGPLDLRSRSYGKMLIKNLKSDYEYTKNPIHVLTAFKIAKLYSLRVPKWVMQYLERVVLDILRSGEEKDNSPPHNKKETEAKRIGKILGFSVGGPGQTSLFKQAKLWERNQEIYYDMIDYMESGTKEYQAYDLVGLKHGLESPSAVKKIFDQMRKHLNPPEEGAGAKK